MKYVLIFFIMFFQNIIGQEKVELQVIGKKTYIVTNKEYKETNNYIVQTHKRKLFVFNFLNKNYSVKIIGRNSKELYVYSNRTILKIKGLFLMDRRFKLVLTEYNN